MPERLQILVSAVNKNIDSLLEDMNISSDAVIVNQIIGEKAPEIEEKRELKGKDILVLQRNE